MHNVQMIKKSYHPQYIEKYLSCDSGHKGMNSVVNCLYIFLCISSHVSLISHPNV